jgi:hypothetical protein
MYFNLNIYDFIINMKRDTFINTFIFISLIYCINYSVTNFLNKNAYDLELEEINLIKKEKSDNKKDDNNVNDNNVNEINMDENVNDINTMDTLDTNDNNINDNNVNEINMDENVNFENADAEIMNDNDVNYINIMDTLHVNADAEIVNADIVNDMNIMDTLIVKVENNIKKRLDKKTKLLLLQDNLNSIKQKLEMLKNELRNNEF